MNKASKGFGLTSVVVAVVLLALAAVFSGNASSAESMITEIESVK